MKLSKKFENKSGRNGKYRVRRYSCTFCDYSELITAGGTGDKMREEQAVDEAKNINKQIIENESNKI